MKSQLTLQLTLESKTSKKLLKLFYTISVILLFCSQDSLAQTTPIEMISLCEAVTPNNTIDDPNITQRGPRSLWWIDEVYQSDTGYLFLKYDFVTNYLNHPDALAYLERFAKVLKEQNSTQLVMLVLPARAMIHHQALEDTRPYPFQEGYESYLQGIQELRDIGIIAPDLATPLLALDPEEAVYFKQDHHWTPAGARAVAQEVAKTLESNPTYQALANKKEFNTELITSEAFLGTYKERIEAVCESQTPTELIDVYQTTEAHTTKVQATETRTNNKSSLQQDLFADNKIPVVLVGTSFSDIESFHFQGFLSDALSTEVLNLAKSSSGQFGSPIYYLADETIRQTVATPNFLIWERHTAAGMSARFVNELRQLIPSVYSLCSDDTAVALRSVEAAGGNILDLGIPKGISGFDYYLAADVEDVSIATIKVHFRYESGFNESLLLGSNIIRPKHFFTELSGVEHSDLTMLRVEFPKEVMSGNITLRICKASTNLQN